MVKRFGARAPVFNIASQFINDCQFHLHSLCYRFGNKLELHELLGSRKDGICTALTEWLFDDLHCNLEYHEHKEWVFALENCMEQDYISFYECMCDGMYTDPVDRGRKLQEIEAEHETTNADIERAAIKLGL